MTDWIYRWLPIIFGCHCRDDRSFHWKGKKFPICARCTGELAGILTGILCWFFFRISVSWSLAILLPMIADGFIQLLTSYESTNRRRAVTGFLFGFGLYMLFAHSTAAAFSYGLSLAENF